jgi:hypothetical protein
MLLESGRSYLWDGQATLKDVANPRIHALSFGKEVEKALEELCAWLETREFCSECIPTL